MTTSRCYKSSPEYGSAKLKSGNPLNACSKDQPDIMTFADLVKGVTEKLYPSRKPDRQCTRLNGKSNPKRAKHAISATTKPMLTSSVSPIISAQDQEICQTAIENNKAILAQNSPNSSPKKNYFCFASEYLAGLEEADVMEKKALLLPVNSKSREWVDRIADQHRSLKDPLFIVAEKEESDRLTKPRFKIPSRVKMSQPTPRQSCSLKQKQNAFYWKKMPGQPIRKRWHPRLEGIAESVEVTC